MLPDSLVVSFLISFHTPPHIFGSQPVPLLFLSISPTFFSLGADLDLFQSYYLELLLPLYSSPPPQVSSSWEIILPCSRVTAQGYLLSLSPLHTPFHLVMVYLGGGTL